MLRMRIGAIVGGPHHQLQLMLPRLTQPFLSTKQKIQYIQQYRVKVVLLFVQTMH